MDSSDLRNLKIGVVLKQILLFIALVFISFIVYFTLRATTPYATSHTGTYYLSFLFVPIVYIISFISKKYYPESKQFILIIIMLSFTIRWMWIFTIDSKQISDYSLLYDSALKLSKGDMSYLSYPYFQSWTYQLGFTMYQAAIMKLFGNYDIVLKLLNVVFSTGICVLIYKIAKIIFNEFTARISSLTYALFIPNIVLSSVLTNDHLSSFLFYFGFYLLIRNNKLNYKTFIISAALISLGNLIRPIGALVIIAVILYVLIYLYLMKKNSFIYLSKLIFIFIISFYSVFYITSYIAIGAGFSNSHLTNHEPMWKFVLGMNYETTGSYSNSDYEEVIKYPLGRERDEFEKKIVINRLNETEKIPGLLINKIGNMWGESDTSIYWSLSESGKPQLSASLIVSSQVVYLLIYIFSFISIICLMFSRRENNKYIFILLLVLGYLTIHLFIEIQTRYRYFIMPVLIIFFGYSLSFINKYFSQKLKNINLTKTIGLSLNTKKRESN
ncbi:ArnT family glycosyltransferase [Paenibacillus borealis]|uniref:ArnT family glycosyltransferase n=1 Tax=Paenibacillus borealis TaxID=160799 RepID=UPI000694B4E5|nr:glycosyltransferase family 39 protein [Paenibacillus borealis]